MSLLGPKVIPHQCWDFSFPILQQLLSILEVSAEIITGSSEDSWSQFKKGLEYSWIWGTKIQNCVEKNPVWLTWLLTSWPLLCSLGTSRTLWFTFTTNTNSVNSELLPKACWKWEILWNKTLLLWRALLGGHGTKHVCANVLSPPLINFITSPCINFCTHYSLSMKIYLIYLLIWQGPFLAFTHQGRQGINLVLQLFGQGLQELHTEAPEDWSKKSSFSFILWWGK